MHGGHSLAGPTNGNYKHGFYFQQIPQHLQGHAAAAFDYEGAVELLSEIALGRTRIAELLERIKQHGGGTWEVVGKAWDELQDALSASEPDPSRIQAAMRHMESVIKKGLAVDYNWRLIDQERERLTGLVSVQTKRDEKAQQNLSSQQANSFAMVILEGVQAALMRHLTDEDDEKYRAIRSDISDVCRAAFAGRALPRGR